MTTAVECKLIRKGGTYAEVYGTEYHFEPYTDGAHVAVIANDEHADAFLAIREGYRLYRGDGKPASGATAPAVKPAAPAPAAAPAEPQEHFAPLGGDYPASFDIGGVTHSLESVVAKAFGDSGLSLTAWNELPQEQRDERIEAVLNALDAAASAAGAAPATDERATLAAEYERLYGKRPHHNTGVEKLREMIAAKQ